MAQKEFIGKDAIYNLTEVLRDHNPNTIFLARGRSSYEKSGAKSVLENILKDYHAVPFFDFEVNPKIEDVEKGLKLFREKKCDFVIAIGGGSTIDIAKLINIFSANEGNITDYVKQKKNIEKSGKPLVAIPTTSGSGSEATHFAVIYLGQTKYSLAHDFIQPDFAIVDFKFTRSLPKYQAACAGMDALGQAIESYWCIHSNEDSKKYAAAAIKLAMENLAEAINRSSEKAQEAMAKAAHLSGKAINRTKTTASHAVSYPITSYFNIPHGHAAALTLAPMLLYNSRITKKDVLDKRGIQYVFHNIKDIVHLLGEERAEKASEKITSLMKEIGLGTQLTELGIQTDDDIEIIIKHGFNPDRVKNNPRKLTETALRKILNDIR